MKKCPVVVFEKCDEYRYENVFAAVRHVCDRLRMRESLKADARVFVKVNNLMNLDPVRAVTTHPLVLKAVLANVLSITKHIVVGDDVNDAVIPDKPFVKSGIKAVCDEMGVTLVNLRDDEHVQVTVAEGKRLSAIITTKCVVAADYFINIPKLKSHQLTLFTGAIKNMYGIMPFGQKVTIHKSNPKPEDFREAVVDIYSARVPDLTIMDAIVGMDGEGPSGGTPKGIGYIIAGYDGVAIDRVCEYMIGLESKDGLVSESACARGMGEAHLEKIDILPLTLEEIRISDFVLPRSARVRRSAPPFLLDIIFNLIVPRPVIKHVSCKRCRACIQHCPQQIMELKGGKVHINYKKCIRCFCCQELCRFDAIKAEQHLIGKIIFKIYHVVKKAVRK